MISPTEERKRRLEKLFEIEFSKSSNRSKKFLVDLVYIFNYLKENIVKLDFIGSMVEVSPFNKTVKLTLLFPENKILMISKPITCGDDKNIIYSFFIDKNLIGSGVLGIDSFVENFNKYLKS